MGTSTEGTLFLRSFTLTVIVLTSTVAAKGILGWASICIVAIEETFKTLYYGYGVFFMYILLGDIEP